MLRCAACGGEVSEWAARCPACRQPAELAVEVPDPVRPWSRLRTRRAARTAVAAAAVILSAALAAGVVSRAARGGPPPTRVLAVTPAGRLVLARGAGGRAPVLADEPDGVAADPSGAELVTADGQVLRLRDGRLRPVGGPVALGPGGWQAIGFADGDRAVVATRATNGLDVEVEAVGPRGRRLLGTALTAAGDPAAPGAFVVDDSGAVRLDVAGRPPATLLTPARAEKALGLSALTDVSLVPIPDRQGRRVAVVVVRPPVTVGAIEPDAIIVVDGTGRIIGVRRYATYGLPAWSPDGRSLLWAVPRVAGVDGAAVWTVGRGAPTVRYTAHPGPALSTCLWASTGEAFLCTASDADPTVPWVLGSARSGAVRVASGPPHPLVLDPR